MIGAYHDRFVLGIDNAAHRAALHSDIIAGKIRDLVAVVFCKLTAFFIYIFI